MTGRAARHVLVSGQVQGVGYRVFVEREAARLGLDGWVRNRRDGTVEAVIAGESGAVEQLIAACRQGPRHAVVRDVQAQDWHGDSITPGGGFAVRATF